MIESNGMPLSPAAKRFSVIVAAALLATGIGAGGFYLYRNHSALPGIATQIPEIAANLPADAPVGAYIDVSALRKLQNSPLAAFLGLSGAGPAEDREYQQFVRDTGFDYSRDLDRVAIAAWPDDSLPQKSAGGGNSRMVAIAEGRFNHQKIEAYALRSGKIDRHGGISIYEIPGDPEFAFEFISASRIIFASGPGASDQILATQSAASKTTGLQVSGNAPVFAVVRAAGLPASFYADFQQSPQIERLIHSIEKLTLTGQPQGNQFAATLDAECDSEKNALEISILLDGARVIGGAALADPKTRKEMTKQQSAFLNDLLGVAKISHDGRSVLLSFTITPEMLATPAQPSH